MEDYSLETPREDIIRACRDLEFNNRLSSEMKELYLNYYTNLLNLKNQEEILNQSKRSNRIALIALIATLIISGLNLYQSRKLYGDSLSVKDTLIQKIREQIKESIESR
jgi:hypothetical protein